MEKQQLMTIIEKSRKRETLLKKLEKLCLLQEDTEDFDIIFNYHTMNEIQLDIHICEMITMFIIYFKHYIEIEEYEIMSLLKKLFNSELRRYIKYQQANNNKNYPMKRLVLTIAIDFNKKDFGLELDLEKNITEIEQELIIENEKK